MKRIHLVMATVLLLMTGCTDNKNKGRETASEPEEEPLPERYENDDLPKTADELFDDFVYYFASNEQLQRRRIAFPLKVNASLVEQQQWQMEPLFMSVGEYAQIFNTPEQKELVNDTTIADAIVEKIFLNADSVRQYVFSRNDGRWQLTEIRDQQLSNNANATFLSFYQQFATDSAFQRNSLCDEIAFSGADPDDDFAEMKGFITPGSWEAFAPELPQDSLYNIVYGKQSTQSKERIFTICGISNGLETELVFQLKRGKWKLASLTE
jgi:hypothetical protein